MVISKILSHTQILDLLYTFHFWIGLTCTEIKKFISHKNSLWTVHQETYVTVIGVGSLSFSVIIIGRLQVQSWLQASNNTGISIAWISETKLDDFYCSGFSDYCLHLYCYFQTFWPIYSPVIFRCLSNLGTNKELRTTFFIASTGVACSDSVHHNRNNTGILNTCTRLWLTESE